MMRNLFLGLLFLVWSCLVLPGTAGAGEATADERWKALCVEAMALANKRDYAQAIALLRPPLDLAIPDQVDSPVAIKALCILGTVYQAANKIAEAERCFGLAVQATSHVTPTSLPGLKAWAGDINIFAARFYVARGKNLEALSRVRVIQKVNDGSAGDFRVCWAKLCEAHLKFSFGYVAASAEATEACLIQCQEKLDDPVYGKLFLETYLAALGHQRLLGFRWAPSAASFKARPLTLSSDDKNPDQTTFTLTMDEKSYSVQWFQATSVATFVDQDPIRTLLVRHIDLKELNGGLANAEISDFYLGLALASMAVTKADEPYKTMAMSRLIDHAQQILDDNGIKMSYNAMAFLWLKYQLYDLVHLPHKTLYQKEIERLLNASQNIREQAALGGDPDILTILNAP